MKTPMQEAIYHIEQWLSSGLEIQGWVTKYKEDYLLREKKAIKNAFNFGGEHDEKWDSISEQYYNETYSNEI